MRKPLPGRKSPQPGGLKAHSKGGKERRLTAECVPWPPFWPGKEFRLVTGALVLTFLLLCLKGIHGFSLASWHSVIDGSEPGEVLLGNPRWIRMDDWAVVLPTALSQRAQNPRFPAVSKVLGKGAVDIRLIPVPAKSWLTLFRPQVWGYFVGSDFGLAWHWWFRVFALAGTLWLVFTLVSRGKTWLSLAGAIALLFSPFYQFWSLNYEPFTAMTGLCFVAVVGLAFTDSLIAIIFYGLLLGWAGACFVLCNLYPPYQIPLAYLFLVLTGSYLFCHRAVLRQVQFPRLRLAVAAAAALMVLFCIAIFYFQISDVLKLLANTVYPGQRRLTGGDVSLHHFFNALCTGFLSPNSFIPLANICEAGSFLFLFPLTLGFASWEWLARGRRPDPVLTAVGIYLLIIVFYALIGFPSFLARITLLDRVQGSRLMLPAGFASMIVTICFLSAQQHVKAFVKPLAEIAGVVLWAAFILLLGLKLMRVLPDLKAWAVLFSVLALATVGMLTLFRHRAALGLLAVLSFASSCWFNPIAQGGSDYLMNNPLSQKIVELDRAAGGNSLWAVYNDRWLGNLFRCLGIRCVNGVHFYPQFDFWAQIDPERKGAAVYNRYAHVVFQLWGRKDEIGFRDSGGDLMVLLIHPENPIFPRLGLDYFIYRGDDSGILRQCSNIVQVAAFHNLRIFRVLKETRR